MGVEGERYLGSLDSISVAGCVPNIPGAPKGDEGYIQKDSEGG